MTRVFLIVCRGRVNNSIVRQTGTPNSQFHHFLSASCANKSLLSFYSIIVRFILVRVFLLKAVLGLHPKMLLIRFDLLTRDVWMSFEEGVCMQLEQQLP